jgi:hypothetical protein
MRPGFSEKHAGRTAKLLTAMETQLNSRWDGLACQLCRQKPVFHCFPLPLSSTTSGVWYDHFVSDHCRRVVSAWRPRDALRIPLSNERRLIRELNGTPRHRTRLDWIHQQPPRFNRLGQQTEEIDSTFWKKTGRLRERPTCRYRAAASERALQFECWSWKPHHGVETRLAHKRFSGGFCRLRPIHRCY